VSFRSMPIALAIAALALMPLALWAGPSATGPKQVAILAPSHSTLDVPIEDIAASLDGATILDKDFPGLRTHTMYRVFKTMSLNQIAAMSHGRITADMLMQAETDLAALPTKAVAPSIRQTDFEELDFAPPGGQGPLSDNASN
jgi:hypothetical protein